MQLKHKLFASLILSSGMFALTGCQSTQAMSDTDGNHVRVNNVTWQKHSAAYSAMPDAQIPTGMSHVVFVRPATNLDDQSSANISLNNRYLVSLQGGNFTESTVCAGTAQLSIIPTGMKVNDLLANDKTFNLPAGKTSYFYVDVDKNGQPSLSQITESNALNLLSNKTFQSHQVSRIVNTCAPSPAAPVIVPPVVAPSTVEIKQGQAFRLGVQFDTNKSMIKPQYQAEINQVATYLNQHPEINVDVEGHTDSVGKDNLNQALSQRRAEAVRQALIAQGVAANRINAIGYGETRPIADNNTPSGREQNRRVIVLGR